MALIKKRGACNGKLPHFFKKSNKYLFLFFFYAKFVVGMSIITFH